MKDDRLRRERFRTLTFNLQQSDRVALHKRISSGQLVPATLSTMSSTELASQEQQESIKQAEQEALEHSILIKTTVPRAKITHKGLQDIEDVNEDSAVAKRREREQLEDEMAEQERERERLARLRTVQPLQHVHSHSHSNPPSASSVPPESPIVPPNSASGLGPAPWGAPPPVPPPPSSQQQASVSVSASASSSDFAHAVDPELNLGDFIHMDDEPPEPAATTAAPSSSPVPPTPGVATASASSDLPTSVGVGESLSSSSSVVAAGQQQQHQQQGPVQQQGLGQGQLSTPITGISPFAASKPDMPPRATFDLNALWSAPPPPPPPPPPPASQPDEDGKASKEGAEANDGGDAMDLDTPTPPLEEVGSRGGVGGQTSAAAVTKGSVSVVVEHEGEGGGGGDDDLDFAMFLGQEEEDREKEKDKEGEKEKEIEKAASSRPDPQVVFEGLPCVWNGTVSSRLLFISLKSKKNRNIEDGGNTDQYAGRFERATGAQGTRAPDWRAQPRVGLAALADALPP